LGRELRALALSHTASVACGVPPPDNSVTNSRTDCALTQQMIGCIKAISLCVKGASQTQSCSWTCTPCRRRVWRGAHVGCSRTGRTRYRWRAAAALTVARTRCVAMCYCHGLGLISSSGPRVTVSGCIRAPRYSRPRTPGRKTKRIRKHSRLMQPFRHSCSQRQTNLVPITKQRVRKSER